MIDTVECKRTYKSRRRQARLDMNNPELRWAVFSRDKHACVDCDGKKNLELWHIKPVVYGGLTVIENLVTLCKTCRSHKPLD